MAESHRDEIAKLEALYQSNPGGRSFTHLAEAYRKAGDAERALETVERGLARHTDYASAYVVLGRVRQDLNQPAEAADAFRRVLELDPENRVAIRALGDLARHGGRLDEALERYRQLRTLDPSDEELEAAMRELESELRLRAEAPEEPAIADLDPFESDYAPPPQEEAEADATALALPESESWDYPSLPPLEPAAPPAEPADGLLSLDELLPPGEAPAEAAPAPREAAERSQPVPSVLDEGRGQAYDWELRGGTGDGEVLTETMAELYRAQGLPARAVEVYRALLADRPEDERLQRRLAEVEAELEGLHAAHEAAPAAPRAEERAGAADAYEAAADEVVAPGEDGPEVALEQIEAAWTGRGGAHGGDPGLYAWADDGGDEEGGRSIGEYFGALLAWHPGAGEAGGRATAGAVAEPEAMDEPAVAAETDEAALGADDLEWLAAEETSSGGEGAGPSADGDATPAAEEASGDDDDLEVFRSWLQGLKR